MKRLLITFGLLVGMFTCTFTQKADAQSRPVYTRECTDKALVKKAKKWIINSIGFDVILSIG